MKLLYKEILITGAITSAICVIAASAGISLAFVFSREDVKFEAACEKKGFVGIKTLSGENRCIEAVYQEDLN